MRRASFEGASKSFTKRPSARTPEGARACDIHIASLIESSDFFWDIRESRADYGVPIAEFFCGVILAIIERWRPHWGCSQPGSRVSRSTRESRRHNRFSKDSLELPRFPLFHRTRRRLCTLKPASATYGAKLLLRKVPQYMGHKAVCQVGRRSFFYDDEVGLKLVYRAIASRQYPWGASGRQTDRQEESPVLYRTPNPQGILWRHVLLEPALANSPT